MYITNDCYFIHIPKNGGTFVRNLLLNNKKDISISKNSCLDYFKRKIAKNFLTFLFLKYEDKRVFLKNIEDQHSTIRKIHPYLMYFRKKQIEYLVILREPIDRFKSIYCQTIRRQHREKYKRFLNWAKSNGFKNINIDIFVDYLCSNSNDLELQKNYVDYPSRYSNQISKVTFIKLKNLTDYMHNRFNLKLKESLNENEIGVIKNSRHYDKVILEKDNIINWETNLTKESLDKLQKLYKEDISLWNSF